MEKSGKQGEPKRVTKKESRSSGKLNFDDIREIAQKQGEIELKRREAYIGRPTQKFLRNLLENGEKTEILPTYEPSSGFRYESVESVFDGNSSPKKAEEFLEHLYGLEILNKSFFDTISACPKCGSTTITLHYCCPKCTSHHIVKTGLTEHIPCGNISEREKYTQSGRMPTCPKCGARLVEGDYRDMGRWYVCRECDEKFEHPQLDLICRACGDEFTIETAFVHEISKYFINPDREQEIRQNVTSLESLYKLLTELNFSVQASASVIGGKSGIQHHFSLLAKKELGDRENVVAIDHAVADVEVGAAPLILYIYKISEVKVDLPIFVAIPKLSETAEQMAQGYNIMVIEGAPQQKEHLDMLKERIQKRLSEAVAQEHGTQDPHPPEVELVHQWIFRKGKRVDVWRDLNGRFVAEEEARAYISRKNSEKNSEARGSKESESDKSTLIGRIKRAIKGD